MMQEDDLVSKDDIRNEGHIEVVRPSSGRREIFPITLTRRSFNFSSTSYKYTIFEVFVAAVVMLSTISGGFLEGYTSPAIPSLMSDSLSKNNIYVVVNGSNDLLHLESSTGVFSNLTFKTPISVDMGHTPEAIMQNPIIVKVDGNNTYVAEDNKSNVSNINIFISNASIPEEKVPSNNETEEILPLPLPLLDGDNGSLTNISTSDYSSGNFEVSREEASWLGSLLLLGACFGAGFSPWVVSLGRRHTIIFSALPRIIGWILIAAASSVSTIYIGRFLSGISLGIVSAAAPIYISEVAHPALRGSLSCVVQLGVSIGIFFAALCGTFMGWRTLAIFGSFTVISYFVPSFFIPNSPSWLIFKGRENEAREVLKKLRTHDYCVEEELQQIITVVEKNLRGNSISWSNLLRERRTLMPLFVVILVTLVNRFSGYNAIITYCSTFLYQVVPSVSTYSAVVAVSFVQILATMLSIVLVDNWGRRKLLMLSVCLMGGSLIFIAICERISYSNEGGSWLAVLGTMCYVGAYSLGIGPLTWVLLGELFPLDARDKASAIVAVLNWFSAFLVTKTYFSLELSAGIGGTCLVYAAVCLLGLFVIYFLVPETKGRTLTEIEVHFSYTQRSWRPPAPIVDRAMSSILDQDVATIDTYSTFH